MLRGLRCVGTVWVDGGHRVTGNDGMVGEDREERRQMLTELGTRLAVVKGYTQLLNRHIDRDEIPRAQLARYCRILDEHIMLLEQSIRRLAGGVDADAVIDESFSLRRIDIEDPDAAGAA